LQVMPGSVEARAESGESVATADVLGGIDQCDEMHATVLPDRSGARTCQVWWGRHSCLPLHSRADRNVCPTGSNPAQRLRCNSRLISRWASAFFFASRLSKSCFPLATA